MKIKTRRGETQLSLTVTEGSPEKENLSNPAGGQQSRSVKGGKQAGKKENKQTQR